MIEALGMLGLLAMTTPILFKKSLDRQNELTDISIANQTRALVNSLQAFVSEYENSINTCISAVHGGTVPNKDTDPSGYATWQAGCQESGIDVSTYSETTGEEVAAWPIDMASTNFAKNLPLGFNTNNKILSYKAALRVDMSDDTPIVTGMVISDKTSVLATSQRGARIASMIGVPGGFVMPGQAAAGEKTLSATGASGAWKLTVNDFFPDEVDAGSVGESSIVGVTGYSEVTGSATGSGCDECLYRVVKDSSTEYNTMETNIYMGTNTTGTYDGPYSIYSYDPDTENLNATGGQIDFRGNLSDGQVSDGSASNNDAGNGAQDVYGDYDSSGNFVTGTGRNLPKYQFLVNSKTKDSTFMPAVDGTKIKDTLDQSNQLQAINDATVSVTKSINTREGEIRLNYFEGGYYYNPTTSAYEYIDPGTKHVKGGSVGNIHIFSSPGDGDEVNAETGAGEEYKGRKSGNIYMHEGGRILVNADQNVGDEYTKEIETAGTGAVVDYEESAAPGSINVYSNADYEADLNNDGDTEDNGESISGTALYSQENRAVGTDTLTIHQKSGGIALKAGTNKDFSGSLDVAGGQIRVESTNTQNSGNVFIRKNQNVDDTASLYMLGSGADAAVASGDILVEGGRMVLLHEGSMASNTYSGLSEDDQRGSIYLHGGQIGIKEDNPETGSLDTVNMYTAADLVSANITDDIDWDNSGTEVDAVSSIAHNFAKSVAQGVLRVEGNSNDYSGQVRILGGSGTDAGALIMSAEGTKNAKIELFGQGNMLDTDNSGGFDLNDLINPHDLQVGSSEGTSTSEFDPANYEFAGLEVPEFNNPGVYQFRLSSGSAFDDSSVTDYNTFSQGAGNMVIAGGRGASSGVLKIYGGDVNADNVGGENTGQIRMYGSSGLNSGSLITFGSKGEGSGSINMFSGSGVNSGNINLLARDTRHIVPGGDEPHLKGGNITLEGGDITMKPMVYPSWSSDEDFEYSAARLAIEDGATEALAGVVEDSTVAGGVEITNATLLQSWYTTNYAEKNKAGNIDVETGGDLHVHSGATATIDGHLYLNGGLTLSETPAAADQVNAELNPSASSTSKFVLNVTRGPIMGGTTVGSKIANSTAGATTTTIWNPPSTNTVWGCQLYHYCNVTYSGETYSGRTWNSCGTGSSTSWQTIRMTASDSGPYSGSVTAVWYPSAAGVIREATTSYTYSIDMNYDGTTETYYGGAGTRCYLGTSGSGIARCPNATADNSNGAVFYNSWTACNSPGSYAGCWQASLGSHYWYWAACSQGVTTPGYTQTIPDAGTITSSSSLKSDYFEGGGYSWTAAKYFDNLKYYLDEDADVDSDVTVGSNLDYSLENTGSIYKSNLSMRRSRLGALTMQGNDGDYSGELIMEGGAGENSGSILMDANNTSTGGKIILYGSRSKNTYISSGDLYTRWQNYTGAQSPFVSSSTPITYPNTGWTAWDILWSGQNPYMADPDDYQFALYGNESNYSGHAVIVGASGVGSGMLKMVGGVGNNSGTIVGLGGGGYNSGGITLFGSAGTMSGGILTKPGSGAASGGLYLTAAYNSSTAPTTGLTDYTWLANTIMTGDGTVLAPSSSGYAGYRFIRFATSGKQNYGYVNIPGSAGYASSYTFSNSLVPKGNRGGDIVLAGGNVILESAEADAEGSNTAASNQSSSGSLIVKGGSVSVTKKGKINLGSNSIDPAEGFNLKRSYKIDEDGFVRYEKQADVQLGAGGGVVGMPLEQAKALKEQLLAAKKAQITGLREQQRKTLEEQGEEALGLSEEDLEKFKNDPTAVIGSDGTLRSAAAGSDNYDARYDENRLESSEFGDLDKLSDNDSYYSEGVLKIDGGGVLVSRPKGKYTSENNDDWGFIRTTSGNIIADDGVVKVDSASKDYVNAGYVKARRLVSGIRYVDPIQKKCKNGDASAGFYGCQDGQSTYGDDEGYDYYEVNPAFTSTMKDIKLASRGGGRMSELLPDFIAKGIYDFSNKYQGPFINKSKKIVGWSSEYLPVSIPSMQADKKKVDECSDDGCETSAWLGFVPAPMCPRNNQGYKPIITLAQTHSVFSPDMITEKGKDNGKIGYNNSARIHSFLGAEPFCIAKGHKADDNAKDDQVDCDTGQSIIVKSDGTIKKGGKREIGSFLGWSILMGFAKPNDAGDEAIINPFPVYKNELGAIAHSYCYFDRKWKDKEGESFRSDIVDVNYDPDNNWGYYKQKPSNINSEHYSEEYKDNMMGINGRDDPALNKQYVIPDASKKSGESSGYVKAPKDSPWYIEKSAK